MAACQGPGETFRRSRGRGGAWDPLRRSCCLDKADGALDPGWGGEGRRGSGRVQRQTGRTQPDGDATCETGALEERAGGWGWDPTVSQAWTCKGDAAAREGLGLRGPSGHRAAPGARAPQPSEAEHRRGSAEEPWEAWQGGEGWPQGQLCWELEERQGDTGVVVTFTRALLVERRGRSQRERVRGSVGGMGGAGDSHLRQLPRAPRSWPGHQSQGATASWGSDVTVPLGASPPLCAQASCPSECH